MNGTKRDTEAADSSNRVVGERCYQRRSRTGMSGGAVASDYAGMSNDKPGENPGRRKP